MLQPTIKCNSNEFEFNTKWLLTCEEAAGKATYIENDYTIEQNFFYNIIGNAYIDSIGKNKYVIYLSWQTLWQF